jgi:menaquinone-specific isochorismate synthase
LRRNGNTVSARLLAGTAWPQPGATDFDRLSRELLASQKNQGEHGYGVRSLVEALEPFCSTMTVPEPEVLVLPNVAHLATNVTAELREDTSLLRLAERVHPTAAVGGTPTPLAVDVIAELEAMDRGRYAGPVGWIDAQGNGEFGVALRCAQVDGAIARLFAGCGIVADSDPDTEAAEAAAKFRAIKSALEA